MSSTIINLIIQIIAGAIGGNAAAAGMDKVDLGKVGNTVAGALGGVGGGQILGALVPALAAAAAASTSRQSWASWSAAVSAVPYSPSSSACLRTRWRNPKQDR
jgi:uncharacterized membrane protein YeaQ/YmgE (transglycosylase-associated protein family)